MPNLYEYIGIRPSATAESIPKAIEATERRWKQTGEINREGREKLLREATEILTNPELRAEYNKKYRLPAPGSIQQEQVYRKKSQEESLARKRGIAVVAIVALAAIIVVGYWMLRPAPEMKSLPVGIYLLDPHTDKAVAILVGRAKDHVFPDSPRGPGCEVLLLDTGNKTWMADSSMWWKFKAGGPAPKNAAAAAAAAAAKNAATAAAAAKNPTGIAAPGTPPGDTVPKNPAGGPIPGLPPGDTAPKSAAPGSPTGGAAPGLPQQPEPARPPK